MDDAKRLLFEARDGLGMKLSVYADEGEVELNIQGLPIWLKAPVAMELGRVLMREAVPAVAEVGDERRPGSSE